MIIYIKVMNRRIKRVILFKIKKTNFGIAVIKLILIVKILIQKIMVAFFLVHQI